MSLYGFDLITQVTTGYHAIIDINYFPNYGGINNFNQILLEFLLKKSNFQIN